MLQSQSNPLDSYYSLKSNITLSHEIGSIVELPQDVDAITCFDKLVKTSCGCENINRKPNILHSIFLILNYKTSHL